MPSDIAVIKDLIETQGRTFDAFKAENDKRLTEIEKRGAPAPEQDQVVDRLNAEITNLTAKIAEVENRRARPDAGGEQADPEAKVRKAAFLDFIRRGDKSPPDMRAALVEDAVGEILVPEDMDAAITRTADEQSVMRQLARTRQTVRNRVGRRSLGDVQVGWGKLELGGALVESTLTPNRAFIYVEDLRGVTKIGEDELDDSDVNLEQEVNDSFGRTIVAAEDMGYLYGGGHDDEEPEGLFDAASAVQRINAAQIGSVKVDDFLALQYEVPARYRKSGKFLMASKTELAIRKLKDSQGQYLWQPSVEAGRPSTFNGAELWNADDIAAVPAAAAGQQPVGVAAFGDFFAGYMIVDRLGVIVKRLDQLFVLEGKVGFIVKRRTGGGVTEPDALRILAVPRA